MMQRRQFTRLLAATAGQIILICSPLGAVVRIARAQLRKRLLPPDTDMGSLLYEDPARLDSRNLPITPIEQFDTMGLTDHDVDLQHWRLDVGGAVSSPLSLSYAQIKSLPAAEREVLLICPGVFAYHARWKGVSISQLLQQAGMVPEATHVEVGGPAGSDERFKRFPLSDITNGNVFLAYSVNGSPLPEPHGFPLRAVAQGYVGSDWIKFADRIDAVIDKEPVESIRNEPGPAFLP